MGGVREGRWERRGEGDGWGDGVEVREACWCLW